MESKEVKTSNDIVLDKEKLAKLKMRIFSLEQNNYESKKLKDNQMVEHILKLIKQEVDNDN